MSTREDLIAGFMRLGLDRQCAEIAASGSTTNPQNNQNTSQSRMVDVSDQMTPYGNK